MAINNTVVNGQCVHPQDKPTTGVAMMPNNSSHIVTSSTHPHKVSMWRSGLKANDKNFQSASVQIRTPPFYHFCTSIIILIPCPFFICNKLTVWKNNQMQIVTINSFFSNTSSKCLQFGLSRLLRKASAFPLFLCET